MNILDIKPGIHYVGVNDRTTTRFEALWSLPNGVSYNAYLVVGDQKTALIDTVEQSYGSQLFQQIECTLQGRTLDYLVVNHMEPDHSSSIIALRHLYPNIKIIGNAKTLQMLAGYYGICDGTIEVSECDTLALGDLTLSFAMIPMVHWPETMVTYCPERKTLFTGDAFGCFGALDGGITDRQLDPARYWDEMRRYYACIVGKYGAPVQKALHKVRSLDLDTLCPTHGPVWQQQIDTVIDLYDRMSRYEAQRGVVIAYGSMYGNTAQMADDMAHALAAEGVAPIVVYNLSTADKSVVLRDIFRYDTLVVGSPTYNGELFPEVSALLQMVSERNIPARNFAFFGSFTWASTALRRLQTFAEQMKWRTPCTPIEMKQGYNRTLYAERCHTLAREIAAMMKS
ncbi:MAG: FprA family A-type flavoprotein [Alistipes sp.]